MKIRTAETMVFSFVVFAAVTATAFYSELVSRLTPAIVLATWAIVGVAAFLVTERRWRRGEKA
jgi:ABC-type uncharacterized transport system permease subunit